MILRAESVSFGYGALPVLDGVSLEFPEGRLAGIVGPNGAGKSTLLRILSGLLRPTAGRVILGDADLASLSRRAVARLMGVVPQSSFPAFPVSVEHFVGLGRFAREPIFGGPTGADADATRRAMAEMQVAHLAGRTVDELSGGEFRRVLIAQALAQEPEILLFDEPVQQLDLLHQIEVMAFAREFARRPGSSAVIVLHDLGLAARYCDTLAILHRGRISASGAPEQVLTADAVREAWGVEASIQRCPATGSLQVVPLSPSKRRTP
jgi:iron complex transport system ATP-binding protein